MNSKKIDYKLVNIALILVIIFLIYLIRGLWMGVLNNILAIIYPFVLAFALAYALYPLVVKLRDKGLPKWAAIGITCFCSIGLAVVLVIALIPIVYNQTLSFLSNLSIFVSDIASKYELNLGNLSGALADISSDIVKNVGSYISNGAISILSSSAAFVTAAVIITFVAIYLLSDMDKIRKNVKEFLYKKNKKTYNYVKSLDVEITNYCSGMFKNMLFQLIEYTLAFFLIGHPNFLILGILAAVTNIIPYFGGLIVNIIALLIASVVSTKLLILTLIVCLVCPNIDSYVISPRIYGKTNKLHPLVNIFAVFAGGVLFGFWGILLSLPVAIIIITTYKFYKEDIYDKIGEIKDKGAN